MFQVPSFEMSATSRMQLQREKPCERRAGGVFSLHDCVVDERKT